MKKHCVDCGAEGKDDSGFCGKCGGKLRYPKTGLAKYATPIVILILLVIIIVLHFVLDK
jgi:predicted nucleic acid-binding Zn ribbon protein